MALAVVAVLVCAALCAAGAEVCMDAQGCARTARGGVFSITSFGAVGDGVTINTAAFAKTIAFAAAQGGGTVVRLCERI